MECRSGGIVRSVGALRCGRQLFFRLCVSFVSQDMDECTCNVDARWRAGETHDVAPIRGRLEGGQEQRRQGAGKSLTDSERATKAICCVGCRYCLR